MSEEKGIIMASDITRLGYREIAERYDLGSLKVGGDLQLAASGVTRDGDLQLGDDVHDALHRAVVRWQFNAPTLKVLFDFVVDAERATAEQKDELENVAQQLVAQRMKRSKVGTGFTMKSASTRLRRKSMPEQ